MRFLNFFKENILFFLAVFLLAFIPLFPKIPLVDVRNTWVYVRAEDFLVLITLFVWFVYLVRRKITLRTPLTIPILVFWIVGGIATIHGVLLIFPYINDVFPNVALLSFLRRIEYMSLFFVAYAAIKDKAMLKYVAAVLVLTLLSVIAYGFGQKYLGFPAFLTMNEEFAKGIPIQLSSLSRVPSTFAGHYDLAAYLVLVVPIVASLVFGVRNVFLKMVLAATVVLGIVLMFMTVSRVSFVVLILSLIMVAFMYKRKLVLFALPVLAIGGFIFLSSSTTLLERFTSTVKDAEVLVDAENGVAIGNTTIVTPDYLEGKVVKTSFTERNEQEGLSLSNAETADPASASGRFVLDSLPKELALVRADNISTGENLPQGTGYINLSLSPVTRKVHEFLYEKKLENNATASAEIYVVYGDYVIKRAAAYDLSFTTRFQGGWPRAMESFMRNVFLGSGYGTVSLAVDNNYLRLMGEIGFLGTVAFVGIFVTMGVFVRKTLPNVDNPFVKSFALGFMAGVVGLALNAVLIDVFEASKVAFTLWLLTGFTLGSLALYQTKTVNVYDSVKEALSSSWAIVVYILLATVLIYMPMLENYFVGDDYTWFRWAADCVQCTPFSQLTAYFTDANGFFYRPGTKAYFLLMYSVFWLNQAAYHLVSIALHFIVAVLVFFLAKRVLKSTLYGAISVFFFLIMSGYSEIVFWASSTGHLFNAVFVLLSMFLFVAWKEKKNIIYLVLSVVCVFMSLLFHELGVVAPLLIIVYAYFTGFLPPWKNLKRPDYLLLFLPIPLYLGMRFLAGSHWSGGDYSYDLLRLPFNIVGNTLGYFLISFFGPIVMPFYTLLRDTLRENLVISAGLVVVLIAISYFTYKKFKNIFGKEDKKILIFSLSLFFISLLPFIGFGNITSRYSYLASIGVVILFVWFLRKLYGYLLVSGKDIAFAGTLTVAVIFYLFHVIQLQGIHSDWYEAGERARRLFVALDREYSDDWSEKRIELHFVNTPIKMGEAWVFPVGLPDALWLVFRNPDIQVFQDSSVESALEQIPYGSLTEKVYLFDESGSIIQVEKELNE